MRHLVIPLVAVLALSIPGRVLQAQHSTPSLAPSATQLVATARLQILGDESRALTEENARQLDLARPSRRTGETLMVVGGAVLLAGLLADETIISIAGVAIGGYGLYVYLNASPKRS